MQGKTKFFRQGAGISIMWWTLNRGHFVKSIAREGHEVQDYLALILGLIFAIVILTGCIDCIGYRFRRRENYLDDATQARNINTTQAENDEAPPETNVDISIPRSEDDASSQSILLTSDSLERALATVRTSRPPKSKPIPIPARH